MMGLSCPCTYTKPRWVCCSMFSLGLWFGDWFWMNSEEIIIARRSRRKICWTDSKLWLNSQVYSKYLLWVLGPLLGVVHAGWLHWGGDFWTESWKLHRSWPCEKGVEGKTRYRGLCDQLEEGWSPWAAGLRVGSSGAALMEEAAEMGRRQTVEGLLVDGCNLAVNAALTMHISSSSSGHWLYEFSHWAHEARAVIMLKIILLGPVCRWAKVHKTLFCLGGSGWRCLTH